MPDYEMKRMTIELMRSPCIGHLESPGIPLYVNDIAAMMSQHLEALGEALALLVEVGTFQHNPPRIYHNTEPLFNA